MTEEKIETRELVEPLFQKVFNQEKIRESKAPIPMAEIKDFMSDKEISFLLKYEDLNMKGKTLMTYLANAGLPIELELGSNPAEAVKAYMEAKNLVWVQSLAVITAAILLESRGVEYEHMFQFPFPKSVVEDFIKDNSEMIERWNKFLDSLPLYLMSTSKDLQSALDEPLEETFKVIDDLDYIGNNIVNVLQVPGFIDGVMGKLEMNEMYYFKQQFDAYMFKGFNLYPYIQAANSSVFHFFHAVLEDKVPYDQMKLFAEGTKLIELDK